MYSCASCLPSSVEGTSSTRQTTPPTRVGGVSEEGEEDQRIAREKEGGGEGARIFV